MRALLLSLLLALGATTGIAQDSPVGGWDLDVDWPQGTARVDLRVSETEDGLHVRWSGRQGTLDGLEPAFEGAELRFVLEVETTRDGSTFETVRLPFRATVAGDRLEGTLKSPLGGTVAVRGTRRPAA